MIDPATLDAAMAILDEEARPILGVPAGESIEQLTDLRRSYLEYALSTLARGRHAMAEVADAGPLEGARYLDVGSAWGGFLAAAAEAGASEVVGAELDERLVRVAARFLAALGAPCRVERVDGTDAEAMAALGDFDVITTNDVVEHVLDVPGFLGNLAHALAPGGRLHIAIPNRRAPLWVRSDPHLHFFGIVLLPRPLAMRYVKEKTRWGGYDIGFFLRFGQYQRWLSRHGLDVELANCPQVDDRRLDALHAEMAALRAMALDWDDPDLSRELVQTVRGAVLASVGRYDREASRARDEPRRQRLLRDYELPVWNVIARRPPVRTAPRRPLHALARRLRAAFDR